MRGNKATILWFTFFKTSALSNIQIGKIFEVIIEKFIINSKMKKLMMILFKKINLPTLMMMKCQRKKIVVKYMIILLIYYLYFLLVFPIISLLNYINKFIFKIMFLEIFFFINHEKFIFKYINNFQKELNHHQNQFGKLNDEEEKL